MAVRRRLVAALARHVDASRFVFEKHGNLTPKLWVWDRHTPDLIAEPETAGAVRATDFQRAQLLCAMQAEHRGSVIGRSDEVWVRIGDDLPILPGPLGEHSDTDPTISTGLLIVGLDTVHDTAAGVVTRRALLDDGRLEWRVAPVPKHLVDRFVGVLILADMLDAEPPAERHASEMDWGLLWV